MLSVGLSLGVGLLESDQGGEQALSSTSAMKEAQITKQRLCGKWRKWQSVKILHFLI